LPHPSSSSDSEEAADSLDDDDDDDDDDDEAAGVLAPFPLAILDLLLGFPEEEDSVSLFLPQFVASKSRVKRLHN
jgi:hypothetical protein